jgi:hypothetical protein
MEIQRGKEKMKERKYNRDIGATLDACFVCWRGPLMTVYLTALKQMHGLVLLELPCQ